MSALVDITGQRLLVMGGGAGIGLSAVRLAVAAGAVVAVTTLPGEVADGVVYQGHAT